MPADQALHSLRHSRVLDVATVASRSGSEALPVQRYPRLNGRRLSTDAHRSCTTIAQKRKPSVPSDKARRDSIPTHDNDRIGLWVPIIRSWVVDQGICGPIVNGYVPPSVPFPGWLGPSGCAVWPIQGSRDHRVASSSCGADAARRQASAHRRGPVAAGRHRPRSATGWPAGLDRYRRHRASVAPTAHRSPRDPPHPGPRTATNDRRDPPTRSADGG